MGETVSTKILLIPWTLITILITSLRHFLNGISRDETFKLCDENAQQHGLMSRLYPGSTSILWRELLKIPVSSSCSNVSLSADTVSTLQAQHKCSEKNKRHDREIHSVEMFHRRMGFQFMFYDPCFVLTTGSWYLSPPSSSTQLKTVYNICKHYSSAGLGLMDTIKEENTLYI